MNETGQMDVENPISATAADFVVDAQAFKETQRAAMFDQSMTAISTLDKTVQLQLLDLAYELSDVPNKEEWVRRLRRLNKQTDPDDPNRDQLEAAADQADQAAADLQKRVVEADIHQKETTAEKAQAGATTARGETMSKAVEIMQMLVANPELARAVDILTNSFQISSTPALTPDASQAVAAGPAQAPATAPPAKTKQPTPGTPSAMTKSYAAP